MSEQRSDPVLHTGNRNNLDSIDADYNAATDPQNITAHQNHHTRGSQKEFRGAAEEIILTTHDDLFTGKRHPQDSHQRVKGRHTGVYRVQQEAPKTSFGPWKRPGTHPPECTAKRRDKLRGSTRIHTKDCLHADTCCRHMTRRMIEDICQVQVHSHGCQYNGAHSAEHMPFERHEC